MKVLNINKFHYLKGGSETYYFALNDLLKEEGINVVNFAMDHPENLESEYKDYFVKRKSADGSIKNKIIFSMNTIYSFEAKNKLEKLLDNEKPDLVHLNIFQHQLSPSILKPIKKRGIPIVYTAHDLKMVCPNYKMLNENGICEECKGHKYFNTVKNKCVKGSVLGSTINMFEMYLHHWINSYEKIDLIITPSNFYREKLIDFGVNSSKIISIPNFLSVEEFEPNFTHDNYFIYYGRLSEEKGVFTLIKAMGILKNTRYKLKIIGTGPLEKEIRNFIQENNILNVELTGFMEGDALYSIIKNSAFVIVPSEWYENGPYTIIESLSLGKPVIGANIGGIPEHITHLEDGLIFQSGNEIDLANKIDYMIENEDKITKYGKRARDRAERYHSKKNYISRIKDIYNNLIEKAKEEVE